MVLRFDDMGMQHRMDAIGEIIMEQGYPTVLCLQASQSLLHPPSCRSTCSGSAPQPVDACLWDPCGCVNPQMILLETQLHACGSAHRGPACAKSSCHLSCTWS